VVDGFADALVRAAAADVSAHGIVNIRIGWIGFLRQQRRRGHDLPGLAVSALRHVFFDPGFCTGCDASVESPSIVVIFFPSHARNRRDARACRLAVDVHRASAAKRHAAAELVPVMFSVSRKHPEERHLRININGRGFSIQRKSCAHVLLPQLVKYPTTPRHRMEITENPPAVRDSVSAVIVKMPRRFASNWLIPARLLRSQIAAQVDFGSKHHRPQCWKARVQRASDLGVAQLFVVEQHQWNFVSFRQTRLTAL